MKKLCQQLAVICTNPNATPQKILPAFQEVRQILAAERVDSEPSLLTIEADARFQRAADLHEELLGLADPWNRSGGDYDLGDREALTYGRTPFETIGAVLDHLKEHFEFRREGGVWADLGSGDGECSFAAALLHPWDECTGIEVMPSLHARAQSLGRHWSSNAWSQRIVGQSTTVPRMTFTTGDLHTDEAADWLRDMGVRGGPDLVFIHSTCFDDKLMHRVSELMDLLPHKCTVVSVSKPIMSPLLQTLDIVKAPLSWGVGTIVLHQRVTDSLDDLSPLAVDHSEHLKIVGDIALPHMARLFSDTVGSLTSTPSHDDDDDDHHTGSFSSHRAALSVECALTLASSAASEVNARALCGDQRSQRQWKDETANENNNTEDDDADEEEEEADGRMGGRGGGVPECLLTMLGAAHGRPSLRPSGGLEHSAFTATERLQLQAGSILCLGALAAHPGCVPGLLKAEVPHSLVKHLKWSNQILKDASIPTALQAAQVTLTGASAACIASCSMLPHVALQFERLGARADLEMFLETVASMDGTLPLLTSESAVESTRSAIAAITRFAPLSR